MLALVVILLLARNYVGIHLVGNFPVVAVVLAIPVIASLLLLIPYRRAKVREKRTRDEQAPQREHEDAERAALRERAGIKRNLIERERKRVLESEIRQELVGRGEIGAANNRARIAGEPFSDRKARLAKQFRDGNELDALLDLIEEGKIKVD